jgi:hypothetical protein
MQEMRIDRSVVVNAATEAGIDLDTITTDLRPTDEIMAPAWKMRATADQLIVFAAQLVENLAAGEHVVDWYESTGFVAELSRHVVLGPINLGTGSMELTFGLCELVSPPEPTQVTVYRSGPSASWELLGAPQGYRIAGERERVMVSAAQLVIDHPGTIIRYEDKGSLTDRMRVANYIPSAARWCAPDTFPCGCPVAVVRDEGHQEGCGYRA